MLRLFILIITICLTLTACDNKPPETIEYGVLKEGLYTNKYFNMSIQLPQDWAIQSKAAQKQIMESGMEMVTGDNKNLKQALKANEQQSLNLFAVFKHKLGTPVRFNPSIIAVAEKVSHTPGIERGADYNFHVKNLLKSGKLPYQFTDETYTQDISGISFDIMPATITTNEIEVSQKYFSARIKDYVLGFVISYTTPAEENSLNDIIATMQFN